MSEWIFKRKRVVKFLSVMMVVISSAICTYMIGGWETCAIALLITSSQIYTAIICLD